MKEMDERKHQNMKRHSMLYNDRINVPQSYLVIEDGGHYRDSKESTSDFHLLSLQDQEK